MATIFTTGFSQLLLLSSACRRSSATSMQLWRPTPAVLSSPRKNSTTELAEGSTLTLKDYVEWSKDMIGGSSDGGPPCWFSPLHCAFPLKGSPLLLYLPGECEYLGDETSVGLSSPPSN
ncbi:hypothetical protein RND71_023639 [Anisodus tanguticus]|uniref:Uncharacterized protein n=1 Tax=Anisodus tanguticus TaxID=243964 RepID=A0AAE1VE00_9SOLA|nr:hypothetical protein RND71_023639 [Anisodus tanguticus]